MNYCIVQNLLKFVTCTIHAYVYNILKLGYSSLCCFWDLVRTKVVLAPKTDAWKDFFIKVRTGHDCTDRRTEKRKRWFLHTPKTLFTGGIKIFDKLLLKFWIPYVHKTCGCSDHCGHPTIVYTGPIQPRSGASCQSGHRPPRSCGPEASGPCERS